MRLRIAGLTISVSSADSAVRQQFIGPTERFLVDDDGVPDVELVLDRVASFPDNPGRLVFDSGGVWRMFDDGEQWTIECSSHVFGDGPYKVAVFDRSFTHGRLLLRRDVFEGDVDALQYPLDEVIVANLLARGRGVELHGCGVIDEHGRGRLFVGQSEAGKTTTARIWLERGGVEIISDDRVIVREIDGEWRMFGTPWHGEAELSSPSSAPLASVALLQQATTTRLVSIPPAEAAARLFGCAFPPFFDAGAVGFTLDCLDRLVNNVPVHVLEFTADATLVDCVLA